MAKFYPLTVKEIRKETADCVSVLLHVPESEKSRFEFQAGQYLTFRKDINGEDVRRSYSICSAPHDGELRVAIKQVPNGVFSGYANNILTVGEQLDTMPPMGRFTISFDKDAEKHYFLVAAGSGITPIISLAKSILINEPKSQITLLFGNQNRGSIIFKSEIEALKNKNLNRFSSYHILSRERADAEIFNGRIDGEKCKTILDKLVKTSSIDDCYLCGPEEMIHAVKAELLESGLAPEHIHFELFTSAASRKATQNHVEQVAIENDETSNVTVVLDGTSFNFKLGYHGVSILDAALAAGADLPFACKGGVCCTCRAKVTEGTADMTLNYALEPDELELGFTLTCQAHPRSENIIVNFDIK